MEKFKIHAHILRSYEGDGEVLRIPEGVEAISRGAFTRCNNFKKIVFPKSLCLVNAKAFDDCRQIEEIEVSPDNPNYFVVQNCLVERVTKKLALGAGKSKIPADGSVTSIGTHAFGGTSESGIFIPKCIEVVEKDAFLMNEGYVIRVEADAVPKGWHNEWCVTGHTEDNVWWEAGEPDILIYFSCKK